MAAAPLIARTPVRITPSVDLVEALENSGTFHFTDLDVTTELPTVAATSPSVGKRRAVKHAGSRGPLFRGLPSPPILLGLATLAVAVGGVLTSTGPDLAGNQPPLRPASALTGESGVAGVNSMRSGSVSRSADRSAADDASGSELLAAAEAQAQERNDALGQMRDLAEKQAKFLADNRWILPLTPSIITATFGQYGLWSSYHTGLDFNGENGDPIQSIAPGTVTFTGYDGAYGNKTVVTLEDGTELWYCHQTSIGVSVGDPVSQGEIIGTVGSTGNVTGSHLHVEVRPGGGDPVDPYAAFVVHGVTP